MEGRNLLVCILLLTLCTLHAEDDADEPCFLEEITENTEVEGENKYSEEANTGYQEEKRNEFRVNKKRRYPEDDYPEFEHLSMLDGVKVRSQV